MSNAMQPMDPSLGTRRQITGLVTKLVGDEATYGFINDEIFFQQINVAGGPATVGDQVFADCEYSAHLPIKWNANSVRILAKGSGQPDVSQQQATATAVHDPRQHSHHQQPALQQAQFNQPPPQVAVTYQQHRQQRMQRQNLTGEEDKQQQDKPLLPQAGQQQPPRLLDQTVNQGDFYQQQQAAAGIPPFQDQTPMGPPKFAFTSQLGSAFVTPNQFSVPPPFLAQQQQPPPSLLPQQAPVPQQQQLPLSHNNQQRGQNKQGGQRFNDKQDNNNRQNNNRGNNRRGNSRDRDGFGQDRQNKRKNSRDRSSGRQQTVGRENKRDDIPTRPSPPPHSSARSSTSVSSDRAVSASSKSRDRKRYEVQNIPKTQIMNNMNSNNMKSRCPSAVHIPSDLKEIIVNKYFRLDIKNTPKPIMYTIEKQQTQDKSGAGESLADDKKPKGEQMTEKETSSEQSNESISKRSQESQGETTTGGANLSESQITPPSSKSSDVRLNHKYGVKIILMSMPELNSIYSSVFGENLDSFNNESGRPSNKRVDEVISLLCNKGSNNGYSLLGGKFDPTLDGFLEGANNPNERNGMQPDLIATCKRIVQDQTGLDLGPCKSWSLLSTFVYNNRSDYFSPKASVEYSYIYMPQIWTMADEYMSKMNIEKLHREAYENEKQKVDDEVASGQVEEEQPPAELTQQKQEETEEALMQQDESGGKLDEPQVPLDSLPGVTLETIGDLRVADLKMELDRRAIPYKPNAKKAELVAILREQLETSAVATGASEVEPATEATADTTGESKLPQTEVSTDQEVKLEQAETSEQVKTEEAQPESETTGNKRKEPEESEDIDESEAKKKVCPEAKDAAVKKKPELVHLIKNSFLVRAKPDQQLSLVSLYDTSTQIGRHDQFELSVASIILKETLIQHFSEYILTVLIEDYRQKQSEAMSTSAASSGGSIGASSQDSSESDSNNNTNKTAKIVAPVSTKELPVDRYINVALTYFDSSHMGYLYFEDLIKLFNNTGLTISKRALISLVGDGEKFHYRSLADLSPKVSPTYRYEFPKQFSSSMSTSGEPIEGQGSNRTVEHKGVVYEVEKLVEQVREAETMQVNLHERFNYAIANSDKQAEEIHLLEVNQKSLSKAIKSQNDEICDLKKERETLKRKIDELGKVLKSVSSLASDALEKSSRN